MHNLHLEDFAPIDHVLFHQGPLADSKAKRILEANLENTAHEGVSAVFVSLVVSQDYSKWKSLTKGTSSLMLNYLD